MDKIRQMFTELSAHDRIMAGYCSLTFLFYSSVQARLRHCAIRAYFHVLAHPGAENLYSIGCKCVVIVCFVLRFTINRHRNYFKMQRKL